VLSKIIAAAEEKFGPVLSAEIKHYTDDTQAMLDNPDYKLVIQRKDPADPTAPFMTITAYLRDGILPCFQNGHYDLRYADLDKHVHAT
jgi:hypothetical protein